MMPYNERVHVWGRVWMGAALVLLISIPITICSVLGVWPTLGDFLTGFLVIAAVYWTITTIEVFTFSPMLGSGGTYLGFVTGNLFNLKVPVALNAMRGLDVKPGSDKGDIISTIAIAASTITTTLVIFVGVMMIIPLTPMLEAQVIQPAFNNIIPALFGALAVVYIGQNWKIAAAPVIIMILVFLLVPGSMDLAGVFVPVSCIISVITARILYRKKWL